MVRAGICVAAGALVSVATWFTVAHFTPVEAAPPADAPPPDAKPAADGKDAKGGKPVDLTALRDAIDTAGKRGENVDEIRKALDVFEKVAPNATAGRVPPELQALRDAVDAAAKKGENVEAIAKELVAVETAVAGKSLARPKPPAPRPEPERPRPERPGFPDFPNPAPFPIVPPAGFGGGGGIDVEMFNKAMELRRKAVELMLKDPRDPDVRKEAEKLQAEASELLLKALRNGGAGNIGIAPPIQMFPNFPEMGRVGDRARLGIRMDRVPALATEQLGLEPNAGIAVSMVVPGSPAEKAGLKVHDIILEFAGKPVTDNTDEFVRRVSEVKAGEKVDLVVLRKGKKVDVKGVELPEAPRPVPMPRLQVPNLLPDGPGKPLPLPGLLPDVPPLPVPLLPKPENPLPAPQVVPKY